MRKKGPLLSAAEVPRECIIRKGLGCAHPELFLTSTAVLFLQLEEFSDDEGPERFLQRWKTWIWKDKVETMTVEFWERFRDQAEKTNLLRVNDSNCGARIVKAHRFFGTLSTRFLSL